MDDLCHSEHDWFTAGLTAIITAGLLLSYVPQHLRIIRKNSSEGFSPWYLLLGATSSTAAGLNMLALSWPTIRCCGEVSFGRCIELTAGVVQVEIQWLLFMAIQVLYIIYYPQDMKYVELIIDDDDTRPPSRTKTPIKTTDWHLSIILNWAVFAHLAICFIITMYLVLNTKLDPTGYEHAAPVTAWATFLGVSSGILAAIQYYPQLVKTYRMKVVGALSIPMMAIQSPGAGIMSVSIALRPGTDWTSWIMYAVSGVMQFILLGMCIVWKIRQNRLGIDDFGHSLVAADETPFTDDSAVVVAVNDGRDILLTTTDSDAREDTPLLPTNHGTKARKGIFRWF